MFGRHEVHRVFPPPRSGNQHLTQRKICASCKKRHFPGQYTSVLTSTISHKELNSHTSVNHSSSSRSEKLTEVLNHAAQFGAPLNFCVQIRDCRGRGDYASSVVGDGRALVGQHTGSGPQGDTTGGSAANRYPFTDGTKLGFFRDHRCWKCQDGRRECVQGNPRRCEYPHARND